MSDPRFFLDVARGHVEAVLARCSAADSPLLADGIDLDGGERFAWEGKTLSNLACQQNFLRLLEALAQLPGGAPYRRRLDDWIGHALGALADPASDLLYWGGHSSYDLDAQKPIAGNHELKSVYPHYGALYGVGPEATRRFIAAFWQAHIWDWGTLLFNRHGEYVDWDRDRVWQGDFAGGPLPIVENTALSFINTGSDLIHAAGQLHVLDGDPRPLAWAGHLVSRYEQIRHPATGLAGYQFNHRDPCRVRASFTGPLAERADLNEATVLTNGTIRTRYGRASVAFLNLAADLGDEKGGFLRDLVRRDLEALADHAYAPQDGRFYPLLNDGTRLDPDRAQEGVGYCPPSKLKPVVADGLMFLAYARAWRQLGDERFGAMARQLAAHMGWGDLEGPAAAGGSPPTDENWAPAGQNDVCTLFGLLDLHAVTGQGALLAAAAALGKRLVGAYDRDGFLVPGRDEQPSHIDSALPLGLVHLAVRLEGGEGAGLADFYPNNTYFDPKIVARKKRA